MNKIFLDCGAWEGNSVSQFKNLYSDSKDYKIYCFECNPDILSRLKKNVDATVIEKAVWEKDGERSFKRGLGRYSESSTLITAKRVIHFNKRDFCRVQCVDFSAWMKNNLSPDDYIVCKLNIEGAEYKVLNKLIHDGTINWINELYVEWHWTKMLMTKDEHDVIADKIPINIKAWELDHSRKAVYTVITDPNYTLKEPKRMTEEWDFICFTNLDIKSKYWTIQKITAFCEDKRKLSRKIKILNDHYLPGYDISLYIDSKFVIDFDLDEFVKKYLIHDMAVLRHKKRHCAYKEANHLINSTTLGLSDSDKKVISKQVKRYRNKGLTEMFGLWAPGIMIRRHNIPSIQTFMKLWHNECMAYSHRDILSLAYTIFKMQNEVIIDEMPFQELYLRLMGK